MSLLLVLAGAGSSNWTQSISDSITLSDALVKSVRQTKADTITATDSQAKSARLIKSDSISLSDAVAKSFAVSKSDTVTLSDLASKAVGKPTSDTITLSDSQSKSAGIYLSDSISISDSIAKAIGLGESDTITLSDLISVPGSAVAYSFTLSDSIGLSDTSVEVLVEGEPVDVFPAQIDGFSVYYGGSVHQLCVVAESDAPSGMGGVLKIRRNGITYAIYLVDVTDPAASHLRIKTATAIKAIRLKA